MVTEGKIGKAVINTVYEHPDLRKMELTEMARELGWAVGSILGAPIDQTTRGKISDRYIQLVRDTTIEAFLTAFDHSVKDYYK